VSDCQAWRDGYPSAHTCDDPVACAMASREPDEDRELLARLDELLDRVESECSGSKSKLAERVLALIHAERGGPRG